MDDSQKSINDYNDKLDSALSEFKKIAIDTQRKSFWDRYAIILLPTFISSIIGVVTFYSAFILSEYKIDVLMKETMEIRECIENLETKFVEIDRDGMSNEMTSEYTKEKIDKIQNMQKIGEQRINSFVLKIKDLEYRVTTLENK